MKLSGENKAFKFWARLSGYLFIHRLRSDLLCNRHTGLSTHSSEVRVKSSLFSALILFARNFSSREWSLINYWSFSFIISKLFLDSHKMNEKVVWPVFLFVTHSIFINSGNKINSRKVSQRQSFVRMLRCGRRVLSECECDEGDFTFCSTHRRWLCQWKSCHWSVFSLPLLILFELLMTHFSQHKTIMLCSTIPLSRCPNSD